MKHEIESFPQTLTPACEGASSRELPKRLSKIGLTLAIGSVVTAVLPIVGLVSGVLALLIALFSLRINSRSSRAWWTLSLSTLGLLLSVSLTIFMIQIYNRLLEASSGGI